MMELQTLIKLEKPGFQIDYATSTLLLGSCFAENIGEKLTYFRFPVDVNPCGIVYNPASVADTLTALVSGRRFTQADLQYQDGKWFSFSHHGRFSDPDPEICLQKINARLEAATARLKTADLLVITWGTAWVYRYKANGQVVANCHKLPEAQFERSRLTVEEIVSLYLPLIRQLREQRPGLRLLFTVSPIRHWKDGAHGNQLSKAVLLLAIDRLRQECEGIGYFPAYEIVMDELRDYRFYAPDMLHISSQGIDYIWEKFRLQYMSPETCLLMNRVDKLNKQLLHRPLGTDTESLLRLQEKARQELRQLGFQTGE